MRCLLSIGCNRYENLDALTGAEADAIRIFNTLLRPDIGGYDAERSRLLLSPNIADLRQAIEDILFGSGQIDTFTLFFAGHGGVRAGSFYMCVRDSRRDALSVSAQSLSDIFRSIGEAAGVIRHGTLTFRKPGRTHGKYRAHRQTAPLLKCVGKGLKGCGGAGLAAD